MKHDGLNHAGHLWGFPAPNGSPGARAPCHRRRDGHGDRNTAARRNPSNRMPGRLYRCLQKRELFGRLAAAGAVQRAALILWTWKKAFRRHHSHKW